VTDDLTNFYLPGAAPFFLPGGPTGCLLLHGFTSAPGELRWLGEAVATDSATIYAPRLAGHGTHQRDLARDHWRDWYGSALDAYHLLRAVCDRVIICGHSMGGVLALLLAAHHPVDGLAILGSPMRFPPRLVRQVGFLRHIQRWSDQTDRSALPEQIRAEQTRRGESPIGRTRYEIWPTAAIHELFALVAHMRPHLPRVTAPLLAIYSTADQVVPVDALDILRAEVGSSAVEHHTLTRSEHNLMLDVERDFVFDRVRHFVQQGPEVAP
jgi:carboxylesterase